ncbi:hypothetical protein [[Phormidium] sp. ETS-05]|uniref:hypothetical protein n=1 Tax=[Phormidium] sp. ETS-05 TaxID=222819 RepID=UPI0018EF0DCC|nr:hypothetical protein [[Phormidium] sp. ETS-05]
MTRLNDRAFKLLLEELDKTSSKDPMGKSLREIILKRLHRLRQEQGPLASEAEIRDQVIDLYPQFSPQVLQAAAKANRAPSFLNQFAIIAAVLGGGAAAIWVVNLPFPMIRKPVAEVAPMLLLPSYIKMDRDYRQATSLVEQADQLVNNATGSADFQLGAEKVTKARQHLDGLPVWFLGYQPKFYCSLFSCAWNFTFDEFEAARKSIGRMEAKLFQEQNSQKELEAAEVAITTAKQQYKQGKTLEAKLEAIESWQAGIDRLAQLPPETLAGQAAAPKIKAAERDLNKVSGFATNTEESGNLIAAAKAFAMQAAILSQNPPHPADQWEQIAKLWEEAIKKLDQVPVNNPGYIEAQTKLAQYKTNLANIHTRKTAETESAAALQLAKEYIAEWQRLAGARRPDRGALASKLQSIINELEKVKPGTTATTEASELLTFAKEAMNKLK